MATHRNMQPTVVFVPQSRGFAHLAKLIGAIGHGLSRGLTSLGEQRVAAVATRPRDGLAMPSNPSDLLARALHDEPNIAMDWLWLSSQVPSVAEQRYCLDRALAISPHSEMARSLRAKLPRTSTF